MEPGDRLDLVVAAVLLVNLSYPEWTGGWLTGPRLLVPLIPFAMIPVAGLLAGGSRWARLAMIAGGLLALMGGVEMLLFQGAGRTHSPSGDGPTDRVRPSRAARRCGLAALDGSRTPIPSWRVRRTILPEPRLLECAEIGSSDWARAGEFVQFLPLVLAQVVAILALWRSRATRVESDEIPGLGDSRGRNGSHLTPGV